MFLEAYEQEWLQNFVSETGSVDFEETDTPYDIFTRFCDANVIRLLADQTNLYYTQYIESKGGLDGLQRNARAHKWNDVTEPEMKVFWQYCCSWD